MDYFPLFLKLKNQPCLVVGAGEIAARKIELLGRTGAQITVIAETVSSNVWAMQTALNLQIQPRSFNTEDVIGMKLVVSATNNRTCNEQVAAAATQHNIPVNVVDNPDLCSFIFPAIVDRSPLIAAISSGGVSPVLARILRAKIESMIPAAYGRLAQFAEEFRMLVKEKIKHPSQRRIFWANR
jgi:uroporphyrin-III C-methyltransferase/precorrin-2 dehydrogenase/sirohydrochlorin ferrochelatase